ncbi:MAG: VanZ family protein [Candidatus Omnitrophica bacterium]|nr:VanZ family protein [Candidatus Omnitrophota bacterium]
MIERKKRWIAALAWVFLIFSTLYVVRPVCDYLSARIPLGIVVNFTTIFSFLLFLFIAAKKFRIRKVSSFLALFFVFCAYIYGLKLLVLPAERVHFIEYGILALLLFRALAADLTLGKSFASAFVLTSLIGWADELVQGLLPNRYYELKDVCLNSISGLLALLSVWVFCREKEAK